MTKDELKALFSDLESDHIERTISTTNTDKFGQAICAFANDLPNHRKPGYLFLGVTDDGNIQGIDVTDEELDAESRENRDIKQQLSVFGFFDTLHDCPTNAAMLFFAKNLRKFIPGAYIQYVRFAGKDRSGDILTEHEFKANLCTTLPELDTFIKTTIANRRPIPVSALREEQVVDYPDWATRELLMNAICHRDYSTNGPIQFYQYDDRIEIMNHGGLYGRANVSNFPNVNDYRNIVVAEAMKVLGFVNRHSRGVLRVQTELKANENGEAVYDFGYQTAILVREYKSPLGERMMAEAFVNGYLTENSENSTKTALSNKKPSKKQTGKQPKKQPKFIIPEFPSQVVENVFKALKMNRKAKYSWLADNLGVSERTIQRAIDDLKKMGYINSEHSKIKGEWQLLK